MNNYASDNTQAIASFTHFIVLFLLLILTGNGFSADAANFDDPYVCSMHPHVVSEGEGQCEICGMGLSRLDGHKKGDPMPDLDQIFASDDNPLYVHEGAGKDPKTGSKLIPISQSPFYQAPAGESHKTETDLTEQYDHSSDHQDLYTCGMHPEVIQEGPGICPICNMDLTPLKKRDSGMSAASVVIDAATMQNIGVFTTEAVVMDLSTEFRSNGIVKIAEGSEYRINTKFPGWIEKLYVARTGDNVKQGDRLFDIYSPQLVTAQEEYLLAMKNAELFSSSSLSDVRMDGQKLLKAAKRRLQLWDISDDQIETLNRTRVVQRVMTIYSPVNGVVMHKNAVEGAFIKAGSDQFRIVDLSLVWIEAQVYEYQLPFVRQGDVARISSPYDQSLSVQGAVQYIYPYLDSKSRSATIRIETVNKNLKFKPEMYVDVVVETQPKSNAVVIPTNAVIRSGKRNIVFVEEGGGSFTPREVRIGIEAGEYIEILEGLSPGTSVVTSAQFLFDSEAKLQEAIQRRLDSIMKKNAKS